MDDPRQPGGLRPVGPRPDDEARLVERDRAAFERLTVAAMPMLLGTARRLVGDGYAAEEVVAEALFRAWRRIDAFRGDARFSTWVHRILCRAAIDRHRREGRDKSRRERLEAATNAGDGPAPRPAWARLAQEESVREAREQLGHLPHAQRMVVLLHVWERMSLRDIAEVLGVRYATAKSNLHHARRALRRLQAESDEASAPGSEGGAV